VGNSHLWYPNVIALLFQGNSMAQITPPICGCSDRSSYIKAQYKCESCGNVCEHCQTSCKKAGHKIRKLRVDEIGTHEDWIRMFGYSS